MTDGSRTDARPVRLFPGANHDARIAIARWRPSPFGHRLHIARKVYSAENSADYRSDAERNGTVHFDHDVWCGLSTTDNASGNAFDKHVRIGD